MERFRQLAKYLQTQLAGLTGSQRIAIALCAALVVGSLAWLLQYSATPDMVSLLSRELGTEELQAAEEALRVNGMSYRVQGSKLFVRSTDRYDALRMLHAGNALPEGSLLDMAALISDENPFQSPEAREYAQNYAKGNELAKILATYPYVKRAAVLINPISKRRVGGGGDVPTASVTVTLAPDKEMTHDMVEGFAKLVSGAVAGLKPYNVNVIDGRTIQSFNVPRPEEAGGFEHWRMVHQLEERLLGKIRTKLADVPGVLASVTVELDSSRRVKQTSVHDAPQPKTEMQQSSDQSSPEAPGEPGVQANIGQSVTSAATGHRQTTEESTVENFEPKLRETETVEQGPSVKKVTAVVGIPRSFIVGVFRARFPDVAAAKDEDAQFQAVQTEQVMRVKTSVEKIIMARAASDVQVDVYPDVEWTASGPAWPTTPVASVTAGAPGGSMDLFEALRTYGPQAGLAGLAIMSLLFMMRVIRKSSEQIVTVGLPPVVEPQIQAPVEPVLSVGPITVGQATASNGFLVGKEVDEDLLRYQELTGEVSKLIKDDPEGSAEMLRRWMDED